MTGPEYHQCTDGPPRPSNRHPVLFAVGDVCLLFGMLTTVVAALYAVIADEPTWWVLAPAEIGMVVFIGTALIAAGIDQYRKGKHHP